MSRLIARVSSPWRRDPAIAIAGRITESGLPPATDTRTTAMKTRRKIGSTNVVSDGNCICFFLIVHCSDEEEREPSPYEELSSPESLVEHDVARGVVRSRCLIGVFANELSQLCD